MEERNNLFPVFLKLEELENLLLAIGRLPHKLKAPFILCVLEEHSQEEAAAILKTSTKAVETRIYRARPRRPAKRDSRHAGKARGPRPRWKTRSH